MNVSDFKKSLTDLKKVIYFDQKQYLREKTTDRTLFEQFIRQARNLLDNCNNLEDKYFLMGTLGNLYRIYGEPQKAVDFFEVCLSIAASEGNKNKEIVSLIRLGEATKYNKNP